MYTKSSPTPPRRRHVLGGEDVAELEVHSLAHGGPPDSWPDEDAPLTRPVGPGGPTVVCAVADDESAEAVVQTAGDLAARFGLRLTLVHSPAADVFLVGESHRSTLDRGHALLDRAAAGSPAAERVVQTGDPAALVNAVADDAAFIVVGSRGRGALASALLGSVSAEIARQAPCPVVIVGARAAAADDQVDLRRAA